MSLNQRFPDIEKPDEDLIAETPADVKAYIESLERRVADLGSAADLLMEMHVFPDILSRIDGMIDASRAWEADRAAPEEDEAPSP
jgi:hypothetical protein